VVECVQCVDVGEELLLFACELSLCLADVGGECGLQLLLALLVVGRERAEAGLDGGVARTQGGGKGRQQGGIGGGGVGESGVGGGRRASIAVAVIALLFFSFLFPWFVLWACCGE